MFVSMKANKKRVLAFVVLALAVIAACLFLRRQEQEQPAEPTPVLGETNEQRVAFLASFGWELEQEPAETREVMIPAQFNDVYLAYNAMQQAQGFDLSAYAGEVCTQYKYHITNYPDEPEVYATLLVYGRLIIGGDLACAEVDGFMHGFAKDSVRYGEATPQPGAAAENGAESDYVTPEPVESSAPESTPTECPPTEDAETAAQPEGGEAPDSAEGEEAAAPLEEDWPTD